MTGWLWDAVLDLRAEMGRIDGEAMNDAQVAQDTEAGEYTWAVETARVIQKHLDRRGGRAGG